MHTVNHIIMKHIVAWSAYCLLLTYYLLCSPGDTWLFGPGPALIYGGEYLVCLPFTLHQPKLIYLKLCKICMHIKFSLARLDNVCVYFANPRHIYLCLI